MNVFKGAFRLVTTTADAAVATAGAVGGAAVSGVIGGVRGVASGVRDGASSGSHSTPAAAVALGLIGAAGLVEWPLLVGIGGTALVIHQLRQNSQSPPPARLRAVADKGSRSASSESRTRRAPANRAPAKKAPAKKAPANRRTPAKAPAKKTAAKSAPRQR